MATTQLPPEGILSNLDEESLVVLSSYGIEHPFNPGDIIIRQGDEQQCLFVVVDGSLQVFTLVNDAEVVLAEIGPGESLGELSIFEPGPASATVRALSPGILWYMDVDRLQAYLEEQPQAACALIMGINQLISRRLRHANETIKSNQIVPGFLSVRARKKIGETQQLPR